MLRGKLITKFKLIQPTDARNHGALIGATRACRPTGAVHAHPTPKHSTLVTLAALVCIRLHTVHCTDGCGPLDQLAPIDSVVHWPHSVHLQVNYILMSL